jgi:ferredoxin-NADP reductase
MAWSQASVVDVAVETPTARTVVLEVPGWPGHRAGQHVDVRLTAEDGYTARRSYSIASAPDGERMELTVERLDDGEVSPYLTEDLQVGDLLEVRGPIGGYFVWPPGTSDGSAGVRSQLFAGGSGVVPLMAMLRLARQSGRPDLVNLLVSVRRPGQLYYSSELPGPQSTIIYTRSTPPSWPRPAGRLSPADLPAPLNPGATGFVCGSSGFADAATAVLREAGMPVDRIRVERFGPTG